MGMKRYILCFQTMLSIGSRLVRDLSIIWAMHFFAFISEGARGWLWFLGNLVTGLWEFPKIRGKYGYMVKSVGNYFPFISGSRFLVTSFPVMSLPMTSLLPLKYDLDGDSILHVLRKQGRDAELIYWNCTNGKALLDTIHELRGKVIISVIQNHGDVLLTNWLGAKCMLLMLIYDCIFYICSFCLFVS
jgi:hypothetical protein